MISDHLRLGRLGARHLLALAGVTLIAISAATGFGLFHDRGPETALAPPANAPAWQPGTVACREDPMVGVPYPTRFIVLARCSTVSGTVQQVRRDPADGELNLLIILDQPYARFLPSVNQGVLRAAVVPPDVPKVRLPGVGQHATFYGAWVLDRNQRSQAALHPVWRVEMSGTGAVAGAASGTMTGAGGKAATARRLKVRMWAPRSVPVGGAMSILVRVESAAKGVRRPEPEANLFFEVRGKNDRGVQWKAATTNALGLARVTLVALEHPGSFQLWLYVDKPGRSAIVAAPVTVRRR
jgi:hypothetical protein